MNKITGLLSLGILSTALFTAHAQSAAPAMPTLSGTMSKLFGDNLAFSSDLELQTADATGKAIVLPARLTFDHGNTRFDFNVSDIKGASLPAGAGDQLKTMGLDQMAMITRPDQKAAYVLYPGAQSFCTQKLSSTQSETNLANVKMETTAIGKETIDGHDCAKNAVVVTGADGAKHESTVWNASDLGNFPVKIMTTEQGQTTVMSFKNISRNKPDGSTFEVPATYQKYESTQSMARGIMMKHMGTGMGNLFR